MKRVTVLTAALLGLLLTLVGLSLPSGAVRADCTWSYTFDDLSGATVYYGAVDGTTIHSDLGYNAMQMVLFDYSFSPSFIITGITANITVISESAALDVIYLDPDTGSLFEVQDTYSGDVTVDSGSIISGYSSGLRIFVAGPESEFVEFYVSSVTVYGEGSNQFGLGTDCGAPPTPTETPMPTSEGGGAPIVITVVVVYPTTEPTALPTEGPSPTPTGNYVLRSTQVFGDQSYDVALKLEVTPADFVQVGFMVVITGLLITLIFVFVHRSQQ